MPLYHSFPLDRILMVFDKSIACFKGLYGDHDHIYTCSSFPTSKPEKNPPSQEARTAIIVVCDRILMVLDNEPGLFHKSPLSHHHHVQLFIVSNWQTRKIPHPKS